MPVLELRGLETVFPVRSTLLRRRVGEVQAVSRVSLTVQPGETVGLVGESGCGKSTVARTIVGLEKPKSGQVLVDGADVTKFDAGGWRQLRRKVQIIFQDPTASLNPRMTVYQLVREGWETIPGIVARERWQQEADKLLERVGLDLKLRDRHPGQLSGGQRQRVCIARALAVRPALIICDEAVSSLDVSVRSQILNLLRRLQRESGVAYLFISHDLGVVRNLCSRIAVMYLGRIVEYGDRQTVYERPAHPYTQALLSAAPAIRPWDHPESEEIILRGDVPSPLSPPSACRFRTRCWRAADRCAEEEPLLREFETREVACHFPGPESTEFAAADGTR